MTRKQRFVCLIWIAGAVLAPVRVNAQTSWGSKPKAVKGEVQNLEVRETKMEVVIALAADVLFDFDKSELRKEAEDSLQKAAEIIRKYPATAVAISGHTDAKGSESYNLALSQRRAESVKAWLVKSGVAAGRIATKGLGATIPVAPNANPDGSDNPAGRQKNRRVEITVQKK